jgi:hypothetical protein
MSGRGDIWIEGEKELYVNMQKHLVTLTDNSRRGLRKAGMNIIADAKANLRSNGSVVTGMLRASGRVQAVDGDPDSIDVGFFGNDTAGGYAYFVEYGRRSGKMPPIKMLMEWLRKRTSKSSALNSALVHIEGRRVRRQQAYTKDYLLESAAWGLAKAIAKKGTKPHPFFGPAVEKNKKAIEDAVAQSIREDL